MPSLKIIETETPGDIKINILNEDIEYIVIQNEETEEEIIKITQYDIDIIKPHYIVRIKDKEKAPQ